MVKGNKDGREIEINFDQMEWKQALAAAEAFAVLVPKEFHGRQECLEAKKKELGLLEEWGVYEEVHRSEVDSKGEEISCMWVVTEKEVESGRVVKACLCARGYEETTYFRRDSPTANKIAIWLVFLMAANRGWDLEGLDAKSAFLQGDKLERLVYLTSPPEFQSKVGGGTVWRLCKCLYGLGDAPRGWYLRVHKELTGEDGAGPCSLHFQELRGGAGHYSSTCR